MKTLVGLIGRKLGHSWSQIWFRNYFHDHTLSADYLLFEIDSVHEIRDILLQNPALIGLNVTIPYKKEVLSVCDAVSPGTMRVGASNCLAIRDGKLIAYNTDVEGLRHLLSFVPGHKTMSGALILGSGGAAAAAIALFKQWQLPFLMASRNPSGDFQVDYASLNKQILESYPLIINATPLGMWPDTGSMPPFPYHLLNGKECLVDLVYNPSETRFMQMGKSKGCFVINGQEMLYHQALKSWEIWISQSDQSHF